MLDILCAFVALAIGLYCIIAVAYGVYLGLNYVIASLWNKYY